MPRAHLDVIRPHSLAIRVSAGGHVGHNANKHKPSKDPVFLRPNINIESVQKLWPSPITIMEAIQALHGVAPNRLSGSSIRRIPRCRAVRCGAVRPRSDFRMDLRVIGCDAYFDLGF